MAAAGTAAASLGDAYASIKAALDVFKVVAPPSRDVPSKEALAAAAQRVKADAAKIGIVCSGGVAPQDQLLALASSLQQSCVALCSTAHTITAVAGPTLKSSLVKLAQGTVNPCLGLVKEMGSGKELKPYVAVVWDGVDAVAKAPVDNKGCLFAALAKVMAAMQDAAREMQELQQEQRERDAAQQPAASSSAADGAGAANGDASDDSDDADDDEYEAGPMSEHERALLDASLELLTASGATLKAFGHALLRGPALGPGDDGLDAWESCLFHCRHLKRAAEDLGAAMYPPQDLAEVASAGLAVLEVTELMADECPDAEAVGAQQLDELGRRLKAAHDRLTAVLAAAHEQGEGEDEGDAEPDAQAS